MLPGATAGAVANGALDISSGGLEAVEATWRAREDAAGLARVPMLQDHSGTECGGYSLCRSMEDTA